MGLHNLPSEGLTDLINDLDGKLQTAMEYGWIDEILRSYYAHPAAPFGTQVEIVGHAISALRGLLMKSASRDYLKRAEMLIAGVEQNKSQRLAAYIELVEAGTFENILRRYTVWKGVLWSTTIKGQSVVFWHPDKDYQPVAATKIKRTGYSELGRRKRRKETANT